MRATPGEAVAFVLVGIMLTLTVQALVENWRAKAGRQRERRFVGGYTNGGKDVKDLKPPRSRGSLVHGTGKAPTNPPPPGSGGFGVHDGTITVGSAMLGGTSPMCTCSQESRARDGWSMRPAQNSPVRPDGSVICVMVHNSCDRPIPSHGRPWVMEGRWMVPAANTHAVRISPFAHEDSSVAHWPGD